MIRLIALPISHLSDAWTEDLGPDDVGSWPGLIPSSGAGAAAEPAPSLDEDLFLENLGTRNLPKLILRRGLCLQVDEDSARVGATASGVVGAVDEVGVADGFADVDGVPTAVVAAAAAAAAAAAVAAAVAI